MGGENQVGTDQIKRALSGLQVVLPKLIVTLKDGFQLTDISALMGDPTFMQAVKNIQASALALKGEAQDLTLDEGVELIGPAAALVAEIVKAVKAQPGA